MTAERLAADPMFLSAVVPACFQLLEKLSDQRPRCLLMYGVRRR